MPSKLIGKGDNGSIMFDYLTQSKWIEQVELVEFDYQKFDWL